MGERSLSWRCGSRCGALLVAALGLLATAGVGCGSGAAPTTPQGRTSASIMVDGIVRTYHVYTPTAVPSRPLPLVVVMHATDEDGTDIEHVSAFDTLARANSFIVAYPDGVGATWNSGWCCGNATTTVQDDLDFINALITTLTTSGRVNPANVYVTGLSAGGAMAYAVGCRLTTRVAAIAVVAGTMALDACQPQAPLSVMEIHGTSDVRLPYDGGAPVGSGVVTPSTPSILQRWATLDGCTAGPSTQSRNGVDVTRWSTCSGGTSVVLDTVEGGTHTWFAPQLEGADGSIDATQAIWDFFKGQRRS